ncbi:MAG TPA: (2Fe-2S)-binding protein [Bryobacteraceae bacterium]|jgi:predicted molibdopterin-dependent oxidoreductase YjgC
MPEKVTIEVNGSELPATAGMSVAAALFQAGVFRFRVSASGQPRAALCGMGICFECRVTIDGQANCRSCQIVVRDGMVIRT